MNKIFCAKSLFLLGLCFQLTLDAQVNSSINFTEEDGLPGNTVRCILKDKKGVIWIATENGIAKFDGDNFININKNSGTPFNMAWALALGEGDEIYAGLFKEGVAIIRNDSLQKIIPVSSHQQVNVRKLYYSNYYKKLFVATDHGLFLLKDSVLIPMKSPQPVGSRSVIMAITGHDSLLFYADEGHFAGIYKLILNKENPENSLVNKITSDGYYACLISGDTLYAGAFQNIFRFNVRDPMIQYPKSRIDTSIFIWNITPYKEGKLWIGGLGDERFRGDFILYDPAVNRSIHPVLKQNLQSVNSIYYDSVTNVTWVGRDNGLTAIFDSPIEHFEMPGNENIVDIGFTGDSLMVLSEEGIYCLKEGKIVPVLSKKQIMSKINYIFYKDYKSKGLSPYRFDSYGFSEIVSFVQEGKKLYISTQRGSLSVPDRGNYLPFAVGTFKLLKNGGAYSYVKYAPLRYYPSLGEAPEWTIPTGPGDEVHDISEIIESNGIFYCISSIRGLYAIKNNIVFKLSTNTPASDNYFIDMDRDQDGNIWCLSATGKLLQIGFSDSVFVKRKIDLIESGLTGNNCRWLIFNGNYMLVGSNKGINIISGKTLNTEFPIVEKFYNSYNGYDFVSAVSPITDKKGKVYLHTLNEVISIDTNFISSTASRIFITNVIINGVNSDINSIENRSLSFRQKQVSFLFNAVKYPMSRNIKYRYKVNNGSWVQGNQVVLQSLRPGSYDISMEGFDKENNTNIVSTLSLNVKPPFWRSIWFILISGISLSLAIFLFVRRRIASLKKQHEEKTNLVLRNSELQLRSLQLQMNPHFIFNALQSVQKFVLSKSVEEALTYIGILSKVIRSNLENASEEYINLSDEIEFLSKYAEIEKLRFKNDLYVEFINMQDIQDIRIPPMLIQPIIENAIKHGIRNNEKKGVVKVNFSHNNEILTVIIEDNGAGREYAKTLKKYEPNSRGLKIISQRLDLLNDMHNTNIHSLSFFDLHEDGKPSGTRVVINLLLNRVK